MHLIVHGDSWAQGAELVDPDLQRQYQNLSPLQIEKVLYAQNCHYQNNASFGGVLSKNLQAESYENLAHAGSSNDSIVRGTVRAVARHLKNHPQEKIFVLIQWTWASRVDLYIDKPVFWLPTHNVDQDGEAYWQTICLYDSVESTSYNKVRKLYYKHCFHRPENVSRFLHQVLFLQSFLKSHNVEYLFFSGNNDPLLPIKLSRQGEFEPYLTDLMHLVDDKRYLHFHQPHNSMFTHLTGKKCDAADAHEDLDSNIFGPDQHPNERGHQIIAENLWSYIQSLRAKAPAPTRELINEL